MDFTFDEIIPLIAENDEEIIIFDYILNTKNRTYHYLDKKPGVFRLEELGDSYCHIHFRFYKADIFRMKALLNIPNEIILKTRIRVNGEEALCIMLRRLAYPCRWNVYVFYSKFSMKTVHFRYADLMQFFPRGRSALSEIFNFMVDHILREKGNILKSLNQPWMSHEAMKRLCRSVRNKGSPYKRCFGFLDGTVRSTCRPTYRQREVRKRRNEIEQR